jgi:hypothetical protein
MKKFSDFSEEMTTTGDAGIPADTVNMGSKKKRAPITRRYIEVMGKKRLQQKEEVEVDEAKIPSNYLQIKARAKKKAKKAELAKAKPAKQEYEYSTHSTGIQKNGKKETIVVKHGRDPKVADAAHKNISKDSFSRHILNRKPVKEATINPTDGKSTGSDSSVKQVKSKADFMKGRKDTRKKPRLSHKEGVEEAKQQRANAGKTNKLSSAEYQKEKKKASFNKNEWKWNGDLYDRVRKEEVEQVDELSTKLLKRYDRKNATSGANLRKKMDKTIATVRKSGSGVATQKQAARFTKAMDKHSNRMDGANRSQQIQLKRAQKESVEQVDEVVGSAIGLAVGAHAVHRAAKKMAHNHGVDSTKKTATNFAKNFGKAVVNPKDYARTGKDVAKGIKSTAQSLRKKMKKESVEQVGEEITKHEIHKSTDHGKTWKFDTEHSTKSRAENQIKQRMKAVSIGKKYKIVRSPGKKLAGPQGKLPESVEQVDELSIKTLSNYNNKASKDPKRAKGNNKAVGKIVKKTMQEGLAVKSGNEGGGYYNTSHNVKHGGNETKTKSGYAKTHADVKKHTGAEDTHVRDYLDSKRGRHLVGKEHDKGYIKKDFAKFSKTYKASDYKWS